MNLRYVVAGDVVQIRDVWAVFKAIQLGWEPSRPDDIISLQGTGAVMINEAVHYLVRHWSTQFNLEGGE